jgi:hypothetical protein
VVTLDGFKTRHELEVSMPDQQGSRSYRLSRGFKNFTALPNEIVRSTSLSGNAKALYAVIIDAVYRGVDPSQAELGEYIGGGAKSARSALSELRDAGLLRVKRPGQGLTNVYTLIHPGDLNVPEGTSGAAAGADPSLSLRPIEARHPTGAQDLVAYFVDESIRLRSQPPGRVTGQVARLVGEMLAEGVVPDRVRAGIDLLLLKRMHPSTLPSLVHEAGLPRRPQPRRDGGMVPTEMMEQALHSAAEEAR